MLVYRIAPRKNNSSENALNGIGGHYCEGRWHYTGQSVVYTASSRALAMLERLVNDSSEVLKKDLTITTVLLSEEVRIKRLSVNELPAGWDAMPYSQHTQQLGTTWLQNKSSAVLQVPSSICPGEFNFVLNPEHIDAQHFKVVDCKPFYYPPRLAEKL